jgi:cell division ATPase FtsA
VLTDDERELGVACVDIGAGTTDVAIFTNGAIRHTAVIPIAGDLITSDIAMALRTPTKDAEDIKVESGFAKQLLADPEQHIEVPGLGDRPPRMLSRQALAGVIEPRVEEIFSLVQQVVRELRLRRGAVIGRGAHGRQRGHAGHGRAGRGHLPQARAARRAQVHGPVRHGGAAARGHRHGPDGRGASRRVCAASRWHQQKSIRENWPLAASRISSWGISDMNP